MSDDKVSDNDTPIHYSHNPHYGEGTFRRRIRLQGQPGKVIAELEDCYHGFRSTVYHDGNTVTDIKAEALRIPLTSCGGATEPIKALIGSPLTFSAMDCHRQVDPRANCTHLYDLTVLAIGHCSRGEVVRQYDVSVDDEKDRVEQSTVQCNGRTVLSWQTRDWAIQSPEQLASKPLYKGFAAWANKTFIGDEREAAFVLQKGYFVSRARMYDMDKLVGTPAAAQTSMLGVCYSYSPGVVDTAFRTAATTRDFTDTPEQLLKFL